MAGLGIAIDETNLNKITRSIRELWQGRSHAVGTFTLTASATSTTVTAANCGDSSTISITPQTANAASALATTYIQAANVTKGQFIVTHANNSQTDRTFSYAIRG